MTEHSAIPEPSAEFTPRRMWIPPLWVCVVSMFAVLAACLGFVWLQARQRMQIVEFVHDHGGYVTFDIGGAAALCHQSANGYSWSRATPSQPDWMIDLFGPTQFYPLTGLVLRGDGARPSSRMMEQLARFSQFESLWLTRCSAIDFDTQLAGISDLPLKKISFSHTHASDTALWHLRQMASLEYLDLTRTRVSNGGLRYLAGLPNLKTVNLSRCKVTLEGAQWLKRQLPGCEILWEPLPRGRRVRL